MAEKVSFAFRNRPLSPVETAVWWIEHVIATGGMDLARTDSMKMNWFVYHSIDVVGTLVAGFLVIAILAYRVAKFCCCRRKAEKLSQKKLKKKVK